MEFVPNHDGQARNNFARGYLAAAEWTFTDTDDAGNEVTREHRGWSARAVKLAHDDCAKFEADNATALAEYYDTYKPRGGYDVVECAGHDFWLTRCGHGAGFWDRGNAPFFETLAEAARLFGNLDVYRTDSAWLDFG